MRTRKKLKRKGEYWLIRSIIGLARLLPRPVGQRLFGGLGALAGRILSRDRLRASANLSIAFPELPVMLRDAMVRAMFKSLGRNAFDFINLENADRAHLDDLVEKVEGMEHLQRTYALGKGVIVLTGHIGCWELMPAYFTALGYHISVVARRMKVTRLDQRLVEIRESFGVKSMDRDSSPWQMVRVLRNGHVLGVLIDQHTSVAGIYVPFFGRPALTPTAVAKLSMMTGAPILPMAVFLNQNGKHVVHVLPPLLASEITDRDDAIREMTERCSLAIEKLVRIDPKQWVWFHHRWREPEGEGRTYAVQN